MFGNRHSALIVFGLWAVATSAAAGSPARAAPASAASGAHVPVALPVALPVASRPAPASAISATADELTRLQDRTVVLQAQLKELEAQQAVTSRLQALSGTTMAPSLDSVRVIAVERIGKTQLATVQLDDGNQFEVAPGERLSDGTRVESIDGDVVAFQQHDGKLRRLRVVVGQGRDAQPLPSGAPAQSRSDALMAPFPN